MKSTPPKETEFITVTDAAKILNVTRGAVYEANKRGSIPFYKAGCINIVKKKDILKYKKNRQVGRPPSKSGRNKK